ncbi:MAG: isoprenylcysteine carboxylmethyltransferase family protein [Flavobacteriales bacterium]|nr:isoprenylcysteine carboxylmethyltransferase family protein [Flavobacteriales bacterium]
MDHRIHTAMSAIWLVILLIWLMLGLRSKSVQAREPWVKRVLFYWLPVAVAFLLLGPGPWFGHSWLRENFIVHSNTVGYVGLMLAVAGASLAIWARVLLGANWSLSVQHKQQHALITSGPYSKVRHPIYTGLLLAFAGNVLIVGDWRGLLALALLFVAFWMKLRKEEQLMLEVFGEDYRAYMNRTGTLLPWH